VFARKFYMLGSRPAWIGVMGFRKGVTFELCISPMLGVLRNYYDMRFKLHPSLMVP
jgi:hypothetical protein